MHLKGQVAMFENSSFASLKTLASADSGDRTSYENNVISLK